MTRGAVLAAALILYSPLTHAAGPFDGRWSVVLTCPTTPDGTLGYNYRFDGTVADSVFRGQNSVEGATGYLVLEGAIRPDGAASLLAHGQTGDPSYTVGRVGRQTPYQYAVQARFTGASGTGQRTAVRPCTLAFEKYR